MSEKLVLDSFALVSLFHKEPGWQRVQAALYAKEKPGRAHCSTGSIGASSSTL